MHDNKKPNEPVANTMKGERNMAKQRKIHGLGAKHHIALLLTLIAVFAACLLPGKRCEAANHTLNMNGAWNSATITTKGGVDLWYFTVTKPGWVTLTYQGQSIGGVELSVWDQDMTKRFSRGDIYTSSDASPITRENLYAFEAGTYCAKVDAHSDRTGNYRMKASFSPANNTETEPNNSFVTAMPLAQGKKVTGFISESLEADETFDTDFYQIVVPKKQKVKITYTQMLRGSHVELWNADQIKIWKADVYYASEDSPLTKVYEETLEPGVYYFKVWVNTYADNAGRYHLVWNTDPGANVGPVEIKAASISVSGNQRVAAGSSFTLKATVKPSNATNAKVNWSSSVKSVATVSSAGKVTTKKPGKTVITAKALDGSGIKKSVTVIVLPKKVSFNSLKPSGSKKLKMTWSSQSSISGYQIQFATKKSFSGAKTTYVTKKSSKTMTLTGLKKKQRYYVRIRSYIKINGKSYYGAWSATRNCKTK